jgi:hypothetical protein
LKICKVSAQNNFNQLQKIAFDNGIEWFGSGKRYYDQAAYFVVVKYEVSGKNRLYLLKNDNPTDFDNCGCVEIKADYFVQNVKNLIKKYLT